MLVYKYPDYLEVTYNSLKNYLLFDWSNATITFEGHKEAHLKAFEVEKEKGVSCLVADCSNMKYSFSREITDWFANEMMPRLAKETEVRRIITILDNTAIAKLNANSWQRTDHGIDLPNVGSLAEAERLLDLSIQSVTA